MGATAIAHRHRPRLALPRLCEAIESRGSCRHGFRAAVSASAACLLRRPVDIGRIVAAADQIRAVTGAHFTYVHHTGKDAARGARGHSLLRAATDTEIEVAACLLTLTKQRDMTGGFTIGFKLIDLGIGTEPGKSPIKSAVVEWQDAGGSKKAAKDKTKTVPPTMRLLMDVVNAAILESGQLIRPFHDEPPVKAVPDSAIRVRYYARVAEKAQPDDEPKRLSARQRKNFDNSVRAALNRQPIIAGEWNGDRWI
jgi:hypothetical protein